MASSSRVLIRADVICWLRVRVWSAMVPPSTGTGLSGTFGLIRDRLCIMTHSVSIDSVVYGDQHGNVAFLDKAEGVIPPPNIRAGDSRHGLPVTSFEMIYLGRPNDVLTRALNHLYYQHRAAPRV